MTSRRDVLEAGAALVALAVSCRARSRGGIAAAGRAAADQPVADAAEAFNTTRRIGELPVMDRPAGWTIPDDMAASQTGGQP